jgi:putative copper resistance protein D
MNPNGIALSILAGLLLALLGPVSHAAATGGDIALLGAANDAAHLLTGGFWLGGLMILALLVHRHWAEPVKLLQPLALFSMWGSFAVALLVATGLTNAVSILPASAWSLHNDYFRLLGLKVGCALAMIGLAALNRWRFAPTLRTEGQRAKPRLAASIGFEIGLGLTVVAIAGYLGLMAPRMA